uniref:Uncharacterized protein n=1 Tax=Oryza brachyantha TaxID=4533 RepID=J3MTB8_ORYBR
MIHRKCSLIPATLVKLQLHGVHLAGDGGPDHVDGVARARGVLVLEVAGDLPEAPPHRRPLALADAPEEAEQEAVPDGVGGADEDAELGVVEDVLEGELDVVADDDGHAVAGDGVEEAVRRRRVAGDGEAELGGGHPAGGAPDAVLPDAPVGEVHVLLVLDQMVQPLTDPSTLKQSPLEIAHYL